MIKAGMPITKKGRSDMLRSLFHEGSIFGSDTRNLEFGMRNEKLGMGKFLWIPDNLFMTLGKFAERILAERVPEQRIEAKRVETQRVCAEGICLDGVGRHRNWLRNWLDAIS